MRAVLCREFGPPRSLKIEEIPDPIPEPGQVAIDIAACGMNYPDVLMCEGKYQAIPPFQPGHRSLGTNRRPG